MEIKVIWYWHKNRPVGQWKTTEDPNTSARSHRRLTFDSGAKNAHSRKDSIVNKRCRNTGCPHAEE